MQDLLSVYQTSISLSASNFAPLFFFLTAIYVHGVTQGEQPKNTTLKIYMWPPA